MKESATLVLKFYAAAGQTVAVRSVQDAKDVLRWMLSDHPGPASVTADEDGASAGRQERGHAAIHGEQGGSLVFAPLTRTHPVPAAG